MGSHELGGLAGAALVLLVLVVIARSEVPTAAAPLGYVTTVSAVVLG